jgi:hypothetical protein
MILGIDGNKWYASNGLDLGDPRAQYEFGDTPQEVIDAYYSDDKIGYYDTLAKHGAYIDMTVAEYRAAEKIIEEDQDEERRNNGQFGAGA